MGFAKKKQRDWFNENIEEMNQLLEEKNTLHKKWLSCGTRSTRRNFYGFQKHLRAETRRMKNDWLQQRANRLPKQLLYGELQEGLRQKGRPRKRFKDELLVSLKKFNIDDLKRCTDRAQWRSFVHNGAKTAENERTERIIDRRTRRKDPSQATDRDFNCQCGKKCASAAGLAAHQRVSH